MVDALAVSVYHFFAIMDQTGLPWDRVAQCMVRHAGIFRFIQQRHDPLLRLIAVDQNVRLDSQRLTLCRMTRSRMLLRFV